MRNSKVVMAVAAGIMAGALAVSLSTVAGGPTPSVAAEVPEQVGRALAQEALKLLGTGGKLTLLARDTTEFPQAAVDLARESFVREVSKNGGSVASVRQFAVDPLRIVQVPPGDFFEALRRAGVGDVIASFMGPPLLTEEQRTALGDIKPKVVAFCSGAMPAYVDLRLLAEQQLLHAAVLSRLTEGAGQAKPAQETFDALYQRVDAAALLIPPSASKGSAR